MVHYTIAMPEPHSHLFHVTVEADGFATPYVDLILPGWTPGSYLIREFARHVEQFQADDGSGAPLEWRKVAKDTWRVLIGAAGRFTARYHVYANELTVRTSHLDGSHGYFNGANVFMYVDGRSAEPQTLTITPFDGWHISTGLRPGDTAHSFVAADYDELVDCPVECGTQRVLEFAVDGIPHYLAIWGYGNEDEARLIADTRRIVEVQRDFFGGLPYDSYTFILHLTDGRGGGLEHRNSVTNAVDRWTFRPERSYERYLGLTSHELFHVWNVKRLRPETLGPFNYRAENYTRLLWVMEGVTSYYDDLLLVRAGLLSPERFMQKLADEIVSLQSQPGRHRQSLEQSSFDAWIKFYRPDENSANTSISYYLKGSLVCLMLDMAIRKHSDGERSLDDLLRYLFNQYPFAGSGIPEDGGMLAAIEAIAGERNGFFRAFYERHIAGTAELDYAEALAVVGLEAHWSHRDAQGGATPAWTGLTVKGGDRAIVSHVRSDGPAYRAGIYPDDELLAIDGWRVSGKKLDQRLAEHSVGDQVRLTLFRGDQLIEISLTLAEAPPDKLELVPMSAMNPEQQEAYRDWLGR
ncbi:MAG: M61 family metallopeptidase [Oscillochloris sp.]|nr:M61 family metallopeptidase [Oscillochloris sp.]